MKIVERTQWEDGSERERGLKWESMGTFTNSHAHIHAENTRTSRGQRNNNDDSAQYNNNQCGKTKRVVSAQNDDKITIIL